MAELKVPKFSAEDALNLTVLTWGQIYAASLRALVDKFGSQEALDMLRPYLLELGKGAPVMAQMLGITGNDAIAISSVIYFVEEQLLKIEGRATEVSPDRVVREITRCPYQDGPLEFGLALLIAVEGMCEGMNPEYKITMPKLMPKGDPICEWIVEKK